MTSFSLSDLDKRIENYPTDEPLVTPSRRPICCTDALVSLSVLRDVLPMDSLMSPKGTRKFSSGDSQVKTLQQDVVHEIPFSRHKLFLTSDCLILCTIKKKLMGENKLIFAARVYAHNLRVRNPDKKEREGREGLMNVCRSTVDGLDIFTIQFQSAQEKENWWMAIDECISEAKKDTVYGVYLNELMMKNPRELGRDVPLLVEECIKYIEANGLDSEGLYRVSGSSEFITEQRDLFNKGKAVQFAPQTEVNGVAGLFKLWLRDLREPLLTYDLLKPFCDACKLPEGEERQTALKNLIHRLPNYHRFVLMDLCNHLNKVASHSDENKMTAKSLAIVIGPNILKTRPEEKDGKFSFSEVFAVVENLLLLSDFVFAGVDEERRQFIISTREELADLREKEVESREIMKRKEQERERMREEIDGAQALLNAGDFGRAKTVIKAVLDSDADHPDALYELACVHARLLQNEDAIMNLNLALKNGFDQFERIANEEHFASLKEIPEFQQVLSSMGSNGSNNSKWKGLKKKGLSKRLSKSFATSPKLAERNRSQTGGNEIAPKNRRSRAMSDAALPSSSSSGSLGGQINVDSLKDVVVNLDTDPDLIRLSQAFASALSSAALAQSDGSGSGVDRDRVRSAPKILRDVLGRARITRPELTVLATAFSQLAGHSGGGDNSVNTSAASPPSAPSSGAAVSAGGDALAPGLLQRRDSVKETIAE